MKKVFVFILIFCVKSLFSSVINKSLDFEDCGSVVDLVSISISSCSYIPCKIQKGNIAEVTMEIDISNSHYKPSSLEFEAEWSLDGLQQAALLLPSYCSISDCLSFTSSGLLTFTVGIYVSDSFPRLSNGYLKWNTKYPPSGDLLMCSRVPVHIY